MGSWIISNHKRVQTPETMIGSLDNMYYIQNTGCATNPQWASPVPDYASKNQQRQFSVAFL